MTLNDLFTKNYSQMISFAKTWLHTSNKQRAEEVVHFTIDYFYNSSDQEKIKKLLDEGDMEKYLFKSLRTMCQSKSAPYHWKNRNNEQSLELLPFAEIQYEEYDLEIDQFVSYKYDTIIKLLYTKYFMDQFYDVEYWEYSKKIFLLFINEGMSLADIHKRTGMSRSTIDYNFKKVRTILINILKDEVLLKSIMPDVDIYKITVPAFDLKKTNIFFMDYFTILTEFQQYCPQIKGSILKKAASQKAKHLSEGIERDKLYICIDIMCHVVKAGNIISDRRVAQERLNLYAEYIAPVPNPYKSMGCSSCMDKVTTQLNFIIEKHKEELINNN